MATWTKAQLATAVLRRLRVVAAGEDAEAEDQALVEEVVDSEHSKLSKLGLVPFATSAIPEWAQRGLLKIVAAEIGPEFGHTNPQMAIFEKREGLNELREQVHQERRDLQTKARFF